MNVDAAGAGAEAAMSRVGTFETCRDVRLESALHTKADIPKSDAKGRCADDKISPKSISQLQTM